MSIEIVANDDSVGSVISDLVGIRRGEIVKIEGVVNESSNLVSLLKIVYAIVPLKEMIGRYVTE